MTAVAFCMRALVRAAANEAESVQLVVHASGELADVKLKLPDSLVCKGGACTIPASALEELED